MRLKLLFLAALAVVFPWMQMHAAWMLHVTLQNLGSGGAAISAIATLGENPAAADGWDWQFDIPIGMPPISGSYVQAYFAHADWGVNNGNYNRDIRFTTPAIKTWNLTLKAYTPISYNYLLSWEVPEEMPDYYSPKLIWGTQTINMRNVSSFSYVTAASTSTCSIRLDLNTGMPYLLAPLGDILFSDNQQQSLNLNQYFAVLSGNLSFAWTANEHLIQSIQTVSGTSYWRLQPIPGWQGSTSVTLSATGTGGTKNVSVPVTRDATNSPPHLTPDNPQLSILQNQTGTFSWANQISDADLDNVSVEIEGGSNFQVFPDNQLQEAIIRPNPGFKGSETLEVLLSDGVNSPQSYPLQVSVLPSVPNPPQNISLQADTGSAMLLTWEQVITDVSGLPLSGIEYRISGYSDPECQSPPIFTYETAEPSALIPASAAKLFLKILSINE